MRITPVILLLIGILGMIYPEKFIADNSGGGRWVFVLIILLGIYTMWRTIKRSSEHKDDL